MKRFIKILAILFLIGVALGYYGYTAIFSTNTKHTESKIITIEKGATFEQVSNQLLDAEILDRPSSFDMVAKLMKYKNKIKSGRYKILPNRSNRELISKLRSGDQDPVKVVINSSRLLTDMAGQISPQLAFDSTSLMTVLLDPSRLEKLGVDEKNVIRLLVPNTYEFFWDVTPEAFLDRMKEEYDRFWSKAGRKDKLAALEMSQEEVSILASIVEKESIQVEERPIIAGLYLNRLKQNIPLQADPTVVFGVGDFTIRRVLNKHLAHESPYNTYLNSGLPPGPICLPSISSIDAVLNAEEHDYLFMCAKPGYNGYHSFAVTNAEHERNARVYRRWLNQQGIRG